MALDLVFLCWQAISNMTSKINLYSSRTSIYFFNAENTLTGFSINKQEYAYVSVSSMN